MAKKSSVARNEKRRRLSEKYAEKRQQLRAVLKDANSSPEARSEARAEMSKLPRNSNPVRIRNRGNLQRPRSAAVTGIHQGNSGNPLSSNRNP